MAKDNGKPAAVRECKVCGKEIEKGAKTAKIVLGVAGERSTTAWGEAHRDCFYRCFPTPDAAIARMEQLVGGAEAC